VRPVQMESRPVLRQEPPPQPFVMEIIQGNRRAETKFTSAAEEKKQ